MIEFLVSHATLIGLLFFFTFFCVMGLWVFRPGAKKIYKEQARIPFEENNK